MRICFASEYYPPFAPGGAEWSTKALAEALGRRGHHVVVVTPNYGAASEETVGGVTVKRILFLPRLRPGQGEAPWFVHRNPLFYLYFAWRLWLIGRGEKVDVVHAQGKAALVPAWIAARFLGRPVLVTVRDLGLLCPLAMCTLFEPWDTFDCTFGQYRRRCVPYFFEHYHSKDSAVRCHVRWFLLMAYRLLDQPWRRLALRRADLVIGVNRHILEMFPQRLVAPGRARVVYTLPPKVTAPTAAEAQAVRSRYGIGEGPLVLYAGKLSLGKGTGVFLEAADLIRAKVPGVRFALAGKGDWPVPEAPDVHRLGSVPQADLFALYAAADVVAVPSVWREPLSRVILEAMALGRPVVATKIGGSPEVIEDGVTGLLVRVDAPEDLARAVSDLLLDPERRRRMGKAARHSAATLLDEERLVQSLLSAYGGAGMAS